MAIKKIKIDFGEGRKTHEYDDRVSKRLQEKEFLGEDDAIEIAINKRIAQKRRRRKI